jgi:hypothetical protein
MSYSTSSNGSEYNASKEEYKIPTKNGIGAHV